MKTITIRYGISSVTRSFLAGTTVGQLVADPNLKAILGYGDRVNVLVGGVAQPSDLQIPDEVTEVTIETAANTKAN